MAMRRSSRSDRPRHRPVLVREVIRWLDLQPGMTVVDGTVGAGGHSAMILPAIAPSGRLIGLDRDPMMLAYAAKTLGAADSHSVDLIHSSYADLPDALRRLGLQTVDRVLLDLGLSSDQLADDERGFSFDADGPLDLRFDTSQGMSAAELLAGASAAELSQLFAEYGEEPAAQRIAERIVAERSSRPIATARDLAEIVEQITPRPRSGSHPATRVFQALRIAVNRELDELRRMLEESLPSCLAPGGRAVIISFHSLEDRMVKEAFRDRSLWQDVTGKPVGPTPSEERMNPRSRTAKLRAAVRV